MRPSRVSHGVRALGGAALLALAAGCAGAEGDVIVSRPAAGGDAGRSTAPREDGAAGADGAAVACTPEAQKLYLLDGEGHLVTFQPEPPQLTDLGAISCPGRSGCFGSRIIVQDPTAMAVDRRGIVWLVGCGSDVVRIDPKTMKCEPVQAALAPASLAPFSATFVVHRAAETLFVAGFGIGPAGTQLATVALPAFSPRPVGALRGRVALAGTGDGELWAWFPPSGADVMPRLARLDQATGRANLTYASATGSWSMTALAFWRGSFWHFPRRGAADPGGMVLRQGRNGTLGEPIPVPNMRRVVEAAAAPCGT